jgi:hypothetical protein
VIPPTWVISSPLLPAGHAGATPPTSSGQSVAPGSSPAPSAPRPGFSASDFSVSFLCVALGAPDRGWNPAGDRGPSSVAHTPICLASPIRSVVGW